MLDFLDMVDPRYFEGSDATNHTCQGCYERPACHIHHMEFKKMGGRKGAAKIASESASNKIELCLVCHDATHIRHSYHGDFSCDVCPRLRTCYYGRRLLNLPYTHLSPRW